jgi:predicted metal-dependent enzyme (double-stranded beta helix superfamily)
MFDLNVFIDDCRAAVVRDTSHKSAQAIMQRVFTDTDAILVALGKPTTGGLTTLYRSKELTILNVVWKPGATLMPHNHKIWAIVGIYIGQEDNSFWQRVPDAEHGVIKKIGGTSLLPGDVMPMGPEIIHSVSIPGTELCGALHVYGGDYFDVPRSEWDAQELTEHPCDMTKVLAFFNQQ